MLSVTPYSVYPEYKLHFGGITHLRLYNRDRAELHFILGLHQTEVHSHEAPLPVLQCDHATNRSVFHAHEEVGYFEITSGYEHCPGHSEHSSAVME